MLSQLAACDHAKAKAAGYKDGWQMLLDKHDGDELALFFRRTRAVLSEAQSHAFYDGLVNEYTEFDNWTDFVTACYDAPDWRPSRETFAQCKLRATSDVT